MRNNAEKTPTNLVLNEVAIYTLFQLADRLNMEDELLAAGAPQMIRDQLINYPDLAQVNFRGCVALNAIARLPHAQQHLFEIGVPNLCVDIMAYYQAIDTTVFTEAVECWAYIADHEDNREKMADEHTVKFIISTMDENLHLPRVQAGCAKALANIARHNSNIARLLHLGGVELVVRELETFPHDDSVQQNSMAMLRSLADGRENLDYLLQKGAAELAVHAMQTHLQDENLLAIGASVLHDMATLTRHRRLLTCSLLLN